MKRKREQMEERKEPKDSSNNKNRRERKKMLCYTVYVNALVFVTYKNIIKTDREGEGEQREGEDRDRRENERESTTAQSMAMSDHQCLFRGIALPYRSTPSASSFVVLSVHRNHKAY